MNFFMKKISTCVLFLMLCSMTGFSQNEKEYIALLPPLNLLSCKNCVDVNPKFYFNNNPELQRLIIDFKTVLSLLVIDNQITLNPIIH